MPYRKHLSKDKKLATLLKNKEAITLQKEKDLHLALCASIISQQLSTKVAAVIYARFLDLFKTTKPKPKDILAIPPEALRGIGLSNAKAGYVQNVCAFFVDNKLTDKRVHAMDDEELIEFLTQIKGIGRWTAEMILMFSLGREDVFAVDDYGIQKAMSRLYGIDMTNKKQMKETMVSIAAHWKPYRTYACRHLWASLDDSNEKGPEKHDL